MQAFSAKLDPRLRQQARRLQQLSALLQRRLPAECLGHFHVAAIRNHTLHIITDSPVWTTRLRQLAGDIVDIVQNNPVAPVRHVQISSRIHYQPVRPPARPVVQRHMSQRSREHILQAAAGIGDPALREALGRLARQGKPSPGKTSPGKSNSGKSDSGK